jgi:hypothetical protein
MKQKTLVIILGQTRADKLTWASFKTHVLDQLNADLALCVGESPNNNNSNFYWVHAKYKWIVPEYEDFGDGFDQIQLERYGHTTNWRRILQVKSQWLGGIKGDGEHPGSAGILIYFRAKLYDFLVKEHIADQYDRFIITRSDFIWEVSHPNVERLKPNFVWIPYGEFYGGVTDRHVVLSRQNLGAYLNLIDPILEDTDALISSMMEAIPKPIWNLERYILFHLKRAHMDSEIRFLPYMMYSVREESTPTRWAQGVYNADLGYYIKYPTEKERAALTKKFLTFRSGKVILLNNRMMVKILKWLFRLKQRNIIS